jgi:catechol 2,3-dioxygenase
MAIHPDSGIGSVDLNVTDLARSRGFYESVIGLRATEREDGTLALGVPDGEPVVELHGNKAAPALNRGATGLYHLAILVPSRHDLALALRRIAESRWPLDGASDHLVSEALYLSDPDGTGIEIYRDRPREEWRRTDGALQMATLPLDLDSLVRELQGPEERTDTLPPGTRIGHVHLQVADLESAEAFYAGALGFDVVVRTYPGALFVSAGGYHHHIGLNTWHSAGAGPPAPDAVGLRSFEVTLPGEEELERTLAGLAAAGFEAERANGSAVVHDPSGNAIVLRTR